MKLRANTIIFVFALTLVAGGSLYIGLPKYQLAQVKKEGMTVNSKTLAVAQAELAAQRTNVPFGSLDRQTWQSLSVPRLGINLTLQAGKYQPKTATWTLDRHHAFIMADTAIPTIYGHNIAAVFKPLAGIATNELLHIQDNQGSTLLFAYKGEQKVRPSDSHVLNNSADNTLRLITCDAAPFSYRRVLEFSYQGILSNQKLVTADGTNAREQSR